MSDFALPEEASAILVGLAAIAIGLVFTTNTVSKLAFARMGGAG